MCEAHSLDQAWLVGQAAVQAEGMSVRRPCALALRRCMPDAVVARLAVCPRLRGFLKHASALVVS